MTSASGITQRLKARLRRTGDAAVVTPRPTKASDSDPARPGLRFLPLVPTIIVLVGAATALASTQLGVDELRRRSDEAAALRSAVLGATLAARLKATPHVAVATSQPGGEGNLHAQKPLPSAASGKPAQKSDASTEDPAGPPASPADRMREKPDPSFNRTVRNAAVASAAEFALVDSHGAMVHGEMDEPPGPPGMLALLEAEAGETVTRHGRSKFQATPLQAPFEGLWLLCFVTPEEIPYATSMLVRSVVVFTILLVTVAALVAYYLARSVHADVSFVRDRIVAMAAPEGRPSGRPIVVRAIDQVGQLTVAFNRLVERFYAAEEAYRRDLSGALNYERERSDFLAALSHELRTPLNVILGFADVLLSEVDGPLSDEARENLLVVRQSGAHLRSLINDILDLSALETGRLNLQLKPTDLWAVASDVVRESRLAAEDKGLEISLEGEPVRAVADQLRVRQVLGNLVSNAVKFTQQGKIAVGVFLQEDMASLRVTDTGPGIAVEEQSLVFEEYRQTGDWQARGAGSGLGLAITRRLVRMHGGRIELKSRLGEGSSFTVLIPVAGPKGGGSLDSTSTPRGDTLRLSSDVIDKLRGRAP